MVAARAGAVSGAWFGLALAVATAAGNGLDRVADVMRLHLALGAVFALLLGACGLAAGGAALPVRRLRGRAGETGLAVTVAVTGWVLAARWFELRMAYPARLDAVRDYGDMLRLAAAFLTVTAAAAAGAGVIVLRGATWARLRGVTAGRCAAGAVAAMVVSAAAFGVRPGGDDPRATAIVSAGIAAPTAAERPAAAAPLSTGITARRDARILLVGCDGADGDAIDALIAEGELPNLRELIRAGVRAPLRTIADRPSPALWTSLATSRKPEDAGIRDFYVQAVLGGRPVQEFPALFGLNRGLLLRDVLGPAAVRVLPVNATMVRARPFWSILAEAGVSVGVVNWLVTWPADADGAAFLVSDRAWTEARPGDGAPGQAEPRLWDPPEVGELLPRDPADWETEDAFVLAAAKRLHAEHRPQVLVAYFRDVDAAEHLSWDEWEPRMFPRGAKQAPRSGPVREMYLRFDAALGELRAAIGEDATVIVVSDHGHRAWFTWLGRGTPGGHTDSPDGIFIAAGPGIRLPEAAIDPSLYDVAPTVLRLVGVPAAADMEGRLLREILADAEPLPMVASWEGRSPATETIAEEDQGTLERLRALGYIR